MPLTIPNALIYLAAFLRPTRLKPDLRIPSISHVDWRDVRRQGYNAVVIDKDNCLTWPHRDELHPSITKGWAQLKEAFGPGNVLVVSNSAGTKKDPGGIAAESVSRALGVPVLLHPRPKPGCAADIVAFFNGHMALHTIGRRTLDDLGRGDGWDVVVRQEERDRREGLGEELVEEEGGTLLGRPSASGITPSLTRRAVQPSTTAPLDPLIAHRTPLDHPRLLVIGDRLATDVLLARRLALFYPSKITSQNGTRVSDIHPVLSVVTTQLFKSSDVRMLRWAEEAWLRLGLSVRKRFARAPREEEERTEEVLRSWVLPRSVDAPPEQVPVVGKTQPVGFATRIRNFRAAWNRWTSAEAWRTWAVGLVPSRAQVWLVVKNIVKGVGRTSRRVAARVMGRIRPATG